MGMTKTQVDELIEATYELGSLPKVGEFAKGGYVTTPNTIITTPNTYTWTTPQPKPIRQVKWTNAEGKTIDYVVHDDGTIHIDEDAFEMLLEQVGFIKKAKEV